ncbi:MAG: GIY-YIG nuclease family protein, partial [Bacteroidetes bacterium]|nr:GIY-YIG nuclease family protein [Bacteroidota bacterium]
DFVENCNTISTHFQRRNYPIDLLVQAFELAKSKSRTELLNKPKIEEKLDNQTVYLTTTHHPSSNFVPNLVRKNWPILGRNNTTMFLHNKKLISGYRRPKNLRDLLMRAKVAPLADDSEVNPYFIHEANVAEIHPAKKSIDKKSVKQTLMTDFITPNVGLEAKKVDTTIVQTIEQLNPILKKPTSIANSIKKEERGYNFCNNNYCRYCPLLNKSGKLKCQFTQESLVTMKNVSCRSSNLIYCITCLVCHKQYVGQTSKRIQNRFAGHFGDISRDNKEKSVPIHFNSDNHRGIKDMQITVLEFIKKSPKSQQACIIRLRRESHWTHLLHTLSPIGLNMENPKEFKIKKP